MHSTRCKDGTKISRGDTLSTQCHRFGRDLAMAPAMPSKCCKVLQSIPKYDPDFCEDIERIWKALSDGRRLFSNGGSHWLYTRHSQPTVLQIVQPIVGLEPDFSLACFCIALHGSRTMHTQEDQVATPLVVVLESFGKLCVSLQQRRVPAR
jgi:hypothetical protein